MSHSSTSKCSSFGNKPEEKASQLMWNSIMTSKSQDMKSPNTTPVSKRTIVKNSKSPTQKNTLLSGGWLSKKSIKENTSSGQEVNPTHKYKFEESKKDTKKKYKPLKVETTNNNAQTSKPNKSAHKPEKLENYNGSKKIKIERFNSGGSLSDDLPCFNDLPPRRKVLPPKRKVGRPPKKGNQSMSKYGVFVPTFEDIINERKEFETYKAQVQTAQSLKEPDVHVSFSPLKNKNKFEQEWLDCKHLSDKRITKYIQKNLDYLREIKNGERFSERHQKYQDKKNHVAKDLTTKNLAYNTSMIVFTFDQIDLMVDILKNEFDPDDLLLEYFFKVLLPELCLKIFMDCHNMSQKDAVEYLDDRPVE